MRRLDSKELLSCRAVVEDALYVVPGQKVNDEEPSWTAPALCPHAPGPRSESASDIVRPQREGSPGPFFAGGGAGLGLGLGSRRAMCCGVHQPTTIGHEGLRRSRGQDADACGMALRPRRTFTTTGDASALQVH
jgi:hypothetical protein